MSERSKPDSKAKPKPKAKSKPRRRRKPPVAVSESRWNPERDPQIAEPYSAARPAGKARCKAALQAELGFKLRSRAPLFLFAGELDAEHGAERLLDALPALLKTSVQVVLLAPRGGALAPRATHLAREHEERVVLLVEEDEALLRRALAGADILLVPAAGSGATAWRGLRYGAAVVAPAGSEVPALLAPPPGARRRPAAAAGDDAVSPLFLFRSVTSLALGRAALKAGEAYRDAAAWRRVRRAAMQVPEQPDESALPRLERPLSPALRERAVSPVMTLAETAHQSTDSPAKPGPSAEPAGEPYIDWGPPPPDRYGEDALELLVQSPRRLYGYWELAPERLKKAGDAGVALVLHVDQEERVLSAQVADLGEWWVDAEPGHRYRMELRDAGGHMLLESARVRTPREAGSEHEAVRFSEDRRRSAKPGGVERGTAPSASRPATRSEPPRSAAAARPANAAPRARPAKTAETARRGVPAARPDRAARPASAASPRALSPAPSSLERPRGGGAGPGADETPFGSSEHVPRKRR